MSGVNTHNLNDNVHQLFDIVDNVHDADIDSHYRDVLGILCPFFYQINQYIGRRFFI